LISAELFIRSAIVNSDPCWVSAFDLGSTETGNPLDILNFGSVPGPFDIKMQIESVSANNVLVQSSLRLREIFKG
jgi:hypothetical protein